MLVFYEAARWQSKSAAGRGRLACPGPPQRERPTLTPPTSVSA